MIANAQCVLAKFIGTGRWAGLKIIHVIISKSESKDAPLIVV